MDLLIIGFFSHAREELRKKGHCNFRTWNSGLASKLKFNISIFPIFYKNHQGRHQKLQISSNRFQKSTVLSCKWFLFQIFYRYFFNIQIIEPLYFLKLRPIFVTSLIILTIHFLPSLSVQPKIQYLNGFYWAQAI